MKLVSSTLCIALATLLPVAVFVLQGLPSPEDIAEPGRDPLVPLLDYEVGVRSVVVWDQ